MDAHLSPFQIRKVVNLWLISGPFVKLGQIAGSLVITMKL